MAIKITANDDGRHSLAVMVVTTFSLCCICFCEQRGAARLDRDGGDLP